MLCVYGVQVYIGPDFVGNCSIAIPQPVRSCSADFCRLVVYYICNICFKSTTSHIYIYTSPYNIAQDTVVPETECTRVASWKDTKLLYIV